MKAFGRKKLLLALCASLWTAACATTDPPAPTWTGVQPEAKRLLSDVDWLADDARGGRRAGTPGERESALWIAERLQDIGLEPVGEDGWLQSFSVPLPVRDGGKSEIQGQGFSVQGAERLVPLFCSEGGSLGGELAFAGYGIQRDASEEGGEAWDDYGGHDFTGKVVLIVRGVPRLDTGEESASGGDTEIHSASSSWGNAGSIFTKVMEAKRRGAVAVLIAPHPDDRDEPLLPFAAARSARAGVPALMVSVSAAEELVPGYAERVRRLDARERRSQEAGMRVELVADVHRTKGKASNVLGLLRGADPGRTVVIGGHFDHLGHGDVGSLSPGQMGTVHNGADDNASGTAVILEVARCLAQGPRPAVNVIFAFWSGEELGLLGSEHWMNQPTVDLEGVVANINLDMVGRAESGKLQVLGAGSAGPLGGWAEAASAVVGIDSQIQRSGSGVGGSDHQVFLRSAIPALHLFTGLHADYHRPTDDVEGFEEEGASQVARFVLELFGRLAQGPDLEFVASEPSENEQRVEGGFRSWLGSVPEYGYEGQGVLISGTSEGSPAERAGLLGGDILLGLGDVPFDNIYDLVFALQRYKPGDTVEVRFLRDGTEESALLTLLSRDVH